ncbi:MAG: ABC transporter permease subunit [Thermomicrobiales bacterium]
MASDLKNAAIPSDGAQEPARYGEIFDRGYKHYDGPRLGRGHAYGALVRFSIKRALGIRKSWTAKIIPILLYVAVALPVVISVGIRAFLPDASVLEYHDFFGFIFIIEGIFVAMIAPEMLCEDRRQNVLPLYFSRAISRADYVVAKLAAVAALTLTMSLVPAAILWLGRQLLEDSPLTAMKDHSGDLGRIIVAGTIIAFYLGSIGLMISSFTPRKAISIAVTIVAFLLSTVLAYALVEAIDSPDYERFLVFLSPTDTITGLVHRLFDVESFDEGSFSYWEFTQWEYLLGMGAIVAVAFGVMWWRYVPNE